MIRTLAVSMTVLWAVVSLSQGTISVTARAVQPGEVAVVSIDDVDGQAPPHVHAFGHDLPMYRDGDHWRAIVGIDLDVKPGTYSITAEPSGASYQLKVLAKTFRTRRLSVDEAFVTPPASAAARIAKEAALLAETWKTSAPERLWSTPFERPVPQPANSAFGTRSIFNGTPRSPHGGADFLSPAGTPILAPNAGRIAVAENLYYSGNTVIIDHGLGVFSMLAHLSRIEVTRDAHVHAGDRIGLVGATGRVTGPHLHWAVRVNDARVDPLSLLKVLGR